ncbi:MAG: hypothetical protein M1837_004790 [Sclerophora amabilis]|nr:MAG: hypothetical protein M1837_004790 [Sclerophora amabilis]
MQSPKHLPSSAEATPSLPSSTHSKLPDLVPISIPTTEHSQTIDTPVAVQKVLELFQAHRSHSSHPDLTDWTVVPITPSEYDHLLHRLSKEDKDLGNYVEDKVRYDYIPHRSKLIIRMATFMHDAFTAKVFDEITRQINATIAHLSPASPLARVLRGLENASTSRIRGWDTPTQTGSPDGSLRFCEMQFPSIILEVSYSKVFKDLELLANEWINMSNGTIQMVIGFDLTYRPRTSEELAGRVLIWEPKLEMGKVPVLTSECTLDMVFGGRDRQEDVSAAEVLTIPLRAIAPRPVLTQYGVSLSQLSDAVVSIDSSTLASFLSKTATTHNLLESGRGMMSVLPSGTQKRNHPQSPERLTDADEATFVGQEEALAKSAATEGSGLGGVGEMPRHA